MRANVAGSLNLTHKVSTPVKFCKTDTLHTQNFCCVISVKESDNVKVKVLLQP